MPDQRVLDEFGLFCQRKKGVNGPDIHMKAAGYGTQGYEDRAWRLAVYNNFCSTPPAAAVYARWSPTYILYDGGGQIEPWVREHWAGLPIRANRRPMRSIPKLARALESLALWMVTDFPTVHNLSYDEAWDSLDSVYTWGRYVKIKFLETCRRFLGPEYAHFEAPGLRAAGGWSPRGAMGLIYPEYKDTIANKRMNDKRTLKFVDEVAGELKDYVSEKWVPVSFYEMEALLCNYRQTLSTRKAFYVGRTIDSELEYDRKVKAHFGPDAYQGQFEFFRTRALAFPSRCLGELHGWDSVRKDISPLLLEHGIVWSDVVYDYNRSKDDLAHPVKWDD